MWSSDFEALLRRHGRDIGPDIVIEPEAPLSALGIDSFALLSMIVEIEGTFEVDIPDAVLASGNFGTPSAVWQAIADQAHHPETA
jgi:acyl carrier protein